MTTTTGLVFEPRELEGRARPEVLRRITGRPVEAFAPIAPNRYAVMVGGYVVAADGEELLVVPSTPAPAVDPAR